MSQQLLSYIMLDKCARSLVKIIKQWNGENECILEALSATPG